MKSIEDLQTFINIKLTLSFNIIVTVYRWHPLPNHVTCDVCGCRKQRTFRISRRNWKWWKWIADDTVDCIRARFSDADNFWCRQWRRICVWLGASADRIHSDATGSKHVAVCMDTNEHGSRWTSVSGILKRICTEFLSRYHWVPQSARADEYFWMRVGSGRSWGTVGAEWVRSLVSLLPVRRKLSSSPKKN